MKSTGFTAADKLTVPIELASAKEIVAAVFAAHSANVASRYSYRESQKKLWAVETVRQAYAVLGVLAKVAALVKGDPKSGYQKTAEVDDLRWGFDSALFSNPEFLMFSWEQAKSVIAGTALPFESTVQDIDSAIYNGVFELKVAYYFTLEAFWSNDLQELEALREDLAKAVLPLKATDRICVVQDLPESKQDFYLSLFN